MAVPIDSYDDFSLKIYDPYDEENGYRYINVVLEAEPIPVPVPEPEPVPVEDEPPAVPIKPVVDTCAR